ncbi:glutamine amidotransferase [Demequina sp. SYSU T00192]|uniref:Glutamine amidotransferase n=1 Tax=Demequina litoralis TaxID=3051660 RepID=A0ABT8G8K3_9MICO|nr:glutamine amidotransferase [Demequina sp. SYSU T00192]MDN4475009.1 glutamine amidotransferase [Demequina sp. SYSU T00192]
MRCVAIRHVAFEDLGVWEAEIAAHGYEVAYLDAGVDDLAPFATADVGIVLGGPVGVDDLADYPVLAEEAALLAARVAATLPTLAVCLGAQLLAHALGGRVEPGEPEVGWGGVDLAPAASSTPLRHLGGAPVLHWHGDRIVPPAGATVLASTRATPCQAFAVGSALALQFHPEVDAERIERWLIGHTGELRALGIDVEAMRARSREAGDDAAVAGILLVREWLRGLERSEA